YKKLDWLVIVVCRSDFFDGWTISPYHFVATHTGISRRNTSRERTTSTRVTIFARNLAVTRVKLMAKWDWLFGFVTDVVNGITGGKKPPRVGDISMTGQREKHA
ncbi:MAG: hypothetical protein WCO71_07990, partial [Pseudomonadota bacterium]